MSIIQIDKVRKDFANVAVLKEVSLEVRDQEFCVLLGPSGCGKTTLLRIMAGLETQTAGDVRIGDRRVNGLPPRLRNIAMVLQNYAVFPHMTIADNIGFGLRMKKADEATIARVADRMLLRNARGKERQEPTLPPPVAKPAPARMIQGARLLPSCTSGTRFERSLSIG